MNQEQKAQDGVYASADFEVRIPQDEGRLSQSEEWCLVTTGDEETRVRFHDYDAIFSVPGLYEHLFYDTLQCSSPRVVCDLLEGVVDKHGDSLAVTDLSVLDVGAGNGMVGEELQNRGVEQVVGLDIIPETAKAAERDRSGVYSDYLVEDLTDLSDHSRRQLETTDFNCMTTVAALGFGDMPPEAFSEAFNFIDDQGWVAFNIRDKFLETGESTGFSRLIERMVDEGVLNNVEQRKYQHRLSMKGEPLFYYAFVARKTRAVPEQWLEEQVL